MTRLREIPTDVLVAEVKRRAGGDPAADVVTEVRRRLDNGNLGHVLHVHAIAVDLDVSPVSVLAAWLQVHDEEILHLSAPSGR